MEGIVPTSHALIRQRIVRGYELLCLVYGVVAVIMLVVSDFAPSAIVILGFGGVVLVFTGMMGVLPEIVGED
jgi:hypothetical protein